MGYKAVYRKAAQKSLEKQPRWVQIRIMDAVDALPNGDVRKLQERDGYRLTVGGFRVLFNYTDTLTDDGFLIIDVFLVGPRGDVYKS